MNTAHKSFLRTLGLSTLVIAGIVAGMIATANPVAAAGRGPRLPVAAPTALSSAEQDALVYMVEEEKLARDVYTLWGETWNVAEFDRIAAGEQKHMDAVDRLLDRYGLANPTDGAAAGKFTNPQLQALYDQLVAAGSVSQEAALQTGVTIEQTDIADLAARRANITHTDILRVFDNLDRGSDRHLAAFTTLLQ